jgi:HK97 family phage prohead protease
MKKFIERPFEVKSIGENGTFTGYGSVFGELDSYRDVVLPGAFTKSLAAYEAKGRPVPMLWQHNSREPIGVYTNIKEDDRGLYVEGQMNMKVQRAVEAHALMEQRALSGLSIGYNTVRAEDDEKSMIRKLIEVDLWEISPVTFPAGDSARIATVKSIEDLMTISDCEDVLRDAGFSRKEAATLISRIKSTESPRDAANEADSSITKAMHHLKSINLR